MNLAALLLLVSATQAPTSDAAYFDIVEKASTAVVASDAAALEAMRFSAFDLDGRPIEPATMLARLADCHPLGLQEEVSPYGVKEVHYECADAPDEKGECDSHILVVAVSRASSPEVFAQLGYKRLETPECELPAVPGPWSS